MKLEKINQSYSVLADNDKCIGRFELGCDGAYYFWMEGYATGFWTAYDLGEIAKLLDSVNMQFDKEVDEYFELLRRNEEDAARVEYRKLLNSGMLLEYSPQLTGVWKNDKNEWFDIFKDLEFLRGGQVNF